MKLIDLLVKELPQRGGWPEEAKIMSQDAAGLINAHRNERLVFLIDQFWTGTSKNDACKNFSPFYLKKATDWNTNTVTREQYEAALAASKAVAGHDGWIEWACDDAAEADDEADLNECIGQDVDVINHPSHYTKGRIECIDAIDSATTGKSGIEAVCVANIIKYLFRYEEKNGLEDVKKAKWYLNKLISELESK